MANFPQLYKARFIFLFYKYIYVPKILNSKSLKASILKMEIIYAI